MSNMNEENFAEESIIGTLFGSINYHDDEVLDMLISNMTKEQSLQIIIKACNYAHNKQAFNLLESEVISKALRVIGK
jgi:hypothetical protein